MRKAALPWILLLALPTLADEAPVEIETKYYALTGEGFTQAELRRIAELMQALTDFKNTADAAIKQAAQWIRGSIRESDVASRVGGDEFWNEDESHGTWTPFLGARILCEYGRIG